MKLRWYQEQAVAAVWNYLQKKDGAPCVVLPTGSGKTLVIAELCRQVVVWGGRVIVLAHVKELLQQAVEKLRTFVDPELVGCYSAGLNERVVDKPIIVAGIQSAYQRAEEFGPVQLIVIDEAHLIPAEGTGRYRTFLEAEKSVSPQARLVGLTATPYRLGVGWITKDRAEKDADRLLDAIVYEAPIDRLIADGTLSTVVSRRARKLPDYSKVRTVRGDFDEAEVEKVLTRKGVLESACREIVDETRDRNKVVVFCNRRQSARRCAQLLQEYSGFQAAVVDGETPAEDRADLIRRFKSDEQTLLGTETLKFICNVGVLTTGFDAPNIDCVALLRPTQSLTLYQQMVGRGLRRAPDKADCLVLDYGGNIERHGPIDMPVVVERSEKPWRVCPKCEGVVSIVYPQCPLCGEPFEVKRRKSDPDAKIQTVASERSILSEPEIVEEYDVKGVEYEVHYKKNDDGKPPTLQVKYLRGFSKPFFEWLCPEHDGWARKRFENWWKTKSKVEPPQSVDVAVEWARAGALATPTKIQTTAKPGERFPRIEWVDFSEIPDFDPSQVKSFEEEFNEFNICSECRSWRPLDEHIPGFCFLIGDSRAPEEAACEKFERDPEIDDLPF